MPDGDRSVPRRICHEVTGEWLRAFALSALRAAPGTRAACRARQALDQQRDIGAGAEDPERGAQAQNARIPVGFVSVEHAMQAVDPGFVDGVDRRPVQRDQDTRPLGRRLEQSTLL